MKFANSFVPLLEFCLITGRFESARCITRELATTRGGGISASLAASFILQYLKKACSGVNGNLEEQAETEIDFYENYR